MMNKFDRDAFTYDSNQMHVERAKTIADAIVSSIPISSSWVMADFGCGTGLLGINFVDRVKHIDMIDTSENMLKVLNEKLTLGGIDNATALQLDIFSDPLPYEKYNLITTLMTFHHIADISEGLGRLSRMLKKGGYLAIADLDKEDGTYHDGEQPPHFGIDQEFLVETALKNRFELIHKSVPYIVNRKNRDYPIFLHIYKKV